MKKSIIKTPIPLKICSANYDDSFVILSAKEIEETKKAEKRTG